MRKIYKIAVAVAGIVGFYVSSYAGPLSSWKDSLERSTLRAQQNYSSAREIKHTHKYREAFQVKIELRTDDDSIRTVTNPGVVVGSKHMMVYLGDLNRGERVKHIAIEGDIHVSGFVGAYNNVWNSEQELYNSLYRDERTQWPDVVLLLTLPYEVSNLPVAVVGMENTLSARTNFERSVRNLYTRWVNVIAKWDSLCEVSLNSISFIASVPQYTTSRPGPVHAAGQPLFAYFEEGNVLGIPSYRKVLVGFKKPGYATYWGFSGWHMQSGKKLAPEVEFLSFK